MQYFVYFQVVFRPQLEITDLWGILQIFVHAVASIMLWNKWSCYGMLKWAIKCLYFKWGARSTLLMHPERSPWLLLIVSEVW